MPINHKHIPSLSSLLTFETAARLGNLTKAANELCVTPTAASKQIKNLEAFLNTQLFIRSKQGVRLTPKGEEYLSGVVGALEMLASSSAQLDDDADAIALNVEIGSCFSHFWLLPRLDDFRNTHPDVPLNFVINNERNIGDNSDYDIAFFYSSIDSINKNNHLLFAERIILVCSPAFKDKYPQCTDINALWRLPILQLKEPLAFWEGWETWAKLYDVPFQEPQNVIQVEDQVSVIQAALNHAGIALAWDWQVRDLLQSGQLVAITNPVDFDKNAFFLSLSEQSRHPAARQFIDWVIGSERVQN